MTPQPKSDWHVYITIANNEVTRTGADIDQVLTRIAKNTGADPAEFIAYYHNEAERDALNERRIVEFVAELNQSTNVGDNIDLHDTGPVTIVKRLSTGKFPMFLCLRISDGELVRGRIRKTADHELPQFIPC